MTKLAVLCIFAETRGFATPEYVRQKLKPNPDRRSFYSYLARLQKQGLLERAPNSRRGRLSSHHQKGPRADYIPNRAVKAAISPLSEVFKKGILPFFVLVIQPCRLDTPARHLQIQMRAPGYPRWLRHVGAPG